MPQKGPNANIDRVSRGEESRNRILNQAIKTASEQGLEALTIGRMAAKLGMSKSGLFAHFGSKRKLQLATIERAKGIFDGEVLEPAEESTKRSEEHTSELQSPCNLVCRLLLEKKKKKKNKNIKQKIEYQL